MNYELKKILNEFDKKLQAHGLTAIIVLTKKIEQPNRFTDLVNKKFSDEEILEALDLSVYDRRYAATLQFTKVEFF